MSLKTAFSIVVFVLAAGMVITLLVFWNVYIISDYHTIKELYMVTHGTPEVPAAGRWTVLSVGITFLSLVLVVLSFYFVTFLRGARFKQQQKDFVNMMTHELKLPMSSIQMFAQTLKTRKASPEERERFIDAILNDCARLNLLLDHLLKSQQIEKGKLPVSLRRLNVSEFVEEFARKWPRPLVLRMIKDVEAQADPVLLELAITNLVNNAEKYGKGSTPEVVMETDPSLVRISVRDAGTPIPKKYAKKIFRRFFRMPNRDTRRQNGVGLGLYIVKTIAKLHQGSIDLTSGMKEADGWKGNRFTLSIPRSK
ncbi:MAG TPA: HAMP domain-containing sensor histidine kinase [Fibrobacteria bacterium]|nr:HAMP domain-containing sensor histidine kinase [Fibrobacteria bacterium]